MSVRLIHGDCTEVLPKLPRDFFDAVVCDPPYHLTSVVKRFGGENAAPAKFGTDGAFARASKGFMGKTWDGGDVAFRPETWVAVLEAMKPGAYLLAFGGTRTFHRMAVAIEDAGFEIRDTIMWLYGSGFPKSHDVSKAIDKAYGAEREVIGISNRCVGPSQKVGFKGSTTFREAEENPGNLLTAPTTPEAAQWEGWGTALKPAYEPIIVARKPLVGTVAENVLQFGTGALNIDACRVGYENDAPDPASNPLYRKLMGYANGNASDSGSNSFSLKDGSGERNPSSLGRWPANVIISYPEDEYTLRHDVTADQKRELFGWLHENA